MGGVSNLSTSCQYHVAWKDGTLELYDINRLVYYIIPCSTDLPRTYSISCLMRQAQQLIWCLEEKICQWIRDYFSFTILLAWVRWMMSCIYHGLWTSYDNIVAWFAFVWILGHEQAKLALFPRILYVRGWYIKLMMYAAMIRSCFVAVGLGYLNFVYYNLHWSHHWRAWTIDTGSKLHREQWVHTHAKQNIWYYD
jgi:hypothetical protein